MKEWFELVNLLASSIVKIETSQGHGTGFLCSYNESRELIAIATAHHVVEHADKWQQPIRIHNVTSSRAVVLQEADRVILPDTDKDSAVIITGTLKVSALNFPEEPVGLLEVGKHKKVGVEVAWLGYPSIGPDTLCFFRGTISAYQPAISSYLIDGVAINGVSGGPVFSRTPEGVQIVGAISAYMPNRLTDSMLPGLSIAQDVTHFHSIVAKMKDRDEAAKKKREQEALSQKGSRSDRQLH
jgi:Trypsin-like peptidase domain